MKDVATMLRSIPEERPPADLSRRIMESLPRHRGLLGHLECALRREIAPGVPVKSVGLLPSTPGEYGITTIIAGLFFLLLALTFVVAIQRAGLDGILSSAIFSLAPAMLGASLLALAGWVQARSPHALVRQRTRLAAVCFLFSLSALIGFIAGGPHIVNMAARLVALSGLVITTGLILIPLYSPTTREAFYGKKSCIA